MKNYKENKLILSAPYLLPVSSPVIRSGAVLIQNGKIAQIGESGSLKNRYPDIPHTHFADSILMPGLINAHIHLEYSALGPVNQRVDFITWINNLIKSQKALPEKDIVSSIYSAINFLIASGTTSIGEVSRSGLSLDPLAESALKGIYYTELVAVDDKKNESLINDFDAAYNMASIMLQKSNFRPGVFPHSIYTLSERTMRFISKFYQEKECPCGIHVAELKDEKEFVNKGTGVLYELTRRLGLDIRLPEGKWSDTIDYLQGMGLITHMNQLVHCVHLDESVFPLLEKFGVGIIICPRSNFFLKNGEFPIMTALKYKLNLGLGTDSLASNVSLDMFEELRFLKEIVIKNSSQSDICIVDIDKCLLEIATIGGAGALGISDGTGSLSPGKDADIIAVKIKKNSDMSHFSPEGYIISHAEASDVCFTMINGKTVHDKAEKELCMQ